MNLERMCIGYKPGGFPLERLRRGYWNRLELSISQRHTRAAVTHWTGRTVCEASTREWPIRAFLYNCTDAAAVQAVARVLAQRALETGVSEVFLQLSEGDLDKERMRNFVSAVRDAGMTLGEAHQYQQENPHRMLMKWQRSHRPWEVVDE